MVKLKLGYIFAIPGGAQFGLAKVIYISERYQDVFLIKLLQHKFDSVEAINLNDKSDKFTLYYAVKEALKKGEWQLLGEEPVSDCQRIGIALECEENIGRDSEKKRLHQRREIRRHHPTDT